MDMFNGTGSPLDSVTYIEGPRRNFDVSTVATSAAPVDCFQGVRVTPTKTLSEAGIPDVLIVPTVYATDIDDLTTGRSDWKEFIKWAKYLHRCGSTVCSISTGAILLAEAGLLSGREAVSHWAYTARLKRRYPAVNFVDGPKVSGGEQGSRVITAACGTAWQELVLCLIQRYAGPSCAGRVARSFSINTSRGRGPSSNFVPLADHGDRLICKSQLAMSRQLREHMAIADAARTTGLSVRTFERRFARATGMSPIKYLQNLRIEQACLQLESTDLAVDAISTLVGYEDLAFFRRLFRRVTGTTPTDYRARNSMAQ
jgi:transcriptional regulator GlxA family with amidase domain